MVETRTYEFVVNFVGDNQDIVFEADGSDAQKFFVRVQTRPAGLCGLRCRKSLTSCSTIFFEVFEVNLVVSVFKDERAVDEFAVILTNHFRERIINRLLQQNRFTGLGEAADGHGQGEDNARGYRQGLWWTVSSHGVSSSS